VFFGVAGVAQDAEDGENVADGAKRCVGHEEVIAIAAVFSKGLGFRHAQSVQTMLVPRFENSTPAVNEATAGSGGVVVVSTLQFVEQMEEPCCCVPCVAGIVERVDVAVETRRQLGLLQKHGVVIFPHQTV